MFGNMQLGDARQSNEEDDGRDFMDGVGADDFGPNAPTVTQQASQLIQDTTGLPIASKFAGINPYFVYAGVALIGYYVYAKYYATE